MDDKELEKREEEMKMEEGRREAMFKRINRAWQKQLLKQQEQR